jgi:hypothetical protein
MKSLAIARLERGKRQGWMEYGKRAESMLGHTIFENSDLKRLSEI